jgi:lysozyme
MQTSEHGLQLLQQWEGFRTNIYKDAARLPTIGVGHLLTKDELTSGKIIINGEPVKYVDGLTEQQVTDLLGQDLHPAEKAVNSGVKIQLDQNQFDALVSFTFNTGSRAFTESTLLKLLNQGKYDEVPNQLRRWVRSGGKVLPGLVNRRENEIKLWLGQV